MTVNIKEEKLIRFLSTKFGKNLNENEERLLSDFYDFLGNEKFENELRNCEIKFAKLINKKYKNIDRSINNPRGATKEEIKKIIEEEKENWTGINMKVCSVEVLTVLDNVLKNIK